MRGLSGLTDSRGRLSRLPNQVETAKSSSLLPRRPVSRGKSISAAASSLYSMQAHRPMHERRALIQTNTNHDLSPFDIPIINIQAIRLHLLLTYRNRFGRRPDRTVGAANQPKIFGRRGYEQIASCTFVPERSEPSSLIDAQAHQSVAQRLAHYDFRTGKNKGREEYLLKLFPHYYIGFDGTKILTFFEKTK